METEEAIIHYNVMNLFVCSTVALHGFQIRNNRGILHFIQNITLRSCERSWLTLAKLWVRISARIPVVLIAIVRVYCF